jgi:hypothetical protein
MRFPGLLFVTLLTACGGTVTPETSTDGGTKADSSSTDTSTTTDSGFDRTCSMPGMCTLVPASCCGSCGVATKTDQIAIPRDKASEYRTLACTADGGGIGCPACAGFPDPELQAFCRAGTCVPIFVPSDSVSACAKDDDCELVSGVCCGVCEGERSLVAVAKTKAGEFTSQICDPRADCAPCAIPTPYKSTARCDPATKHCVINRVL